MNDPSLEFALQRYIYDYLEAGGGIDLKSETGWENMNLARYLANELLKYSWIKEEDDSQISNN